MKPLLKLILTVVKILGFVWIIITYISASIANFTPTFSFSFTISAWLQWDNYIMYSEIVHENNKSSMKKWLGAIH